MAENRYVGDYPVIGIRPTIDGRRGYLKVRESLEEQTMNMAKSAAKLFTYVITGPGEAGIKLEYRRPWESGKAPLKTFDIMIRASGESMFEQENGRDGTRRVGSKGQVEYR